MERKKRALTLLEVVIAVVLLGALLTGLFSVFRQGLKKNISSRELKQNVLQVELFQQKIKILLSEENGVWIEQHPDAAGPALFVDFEQKVDPDFEMCGKLQAMLFLNPKKELCFVSWSEKGKGRLEILLDNVDDFKCRLFDSEKGEWSSSWPKKKEASPPMLYIDLTWNKEKIPFVFFLKPSHEKIIYKGTL
jgi:hypothetical protein